MKTKQYLEEQVKSLFEDEELNAIKAKRAIGKVLNAIVKAIESNADINNINFTDADMIKFVEAFDHKGYAKKMLVAYFKTT